MNWNQYEKLIQQQIQEARAIKEHTEKEYKQASARLDTLEHQYESFKLAITKMLGE